MTQDQEDTRAAAFHISQMLGPFFAKDFAAWLEEDPDRLKRASRLLTILTRDSKNELKLRPTDLFQENHIPFVEISAIAKDRADGFEEHHPHAKTCTLCDAFIEVEAARLVFERGMETDLSGVEARTLRHLTDNDKGLGRDPTPRE